MQGNVCKDYLEIERRITDMAAMLMYHNKQKLTRTLLLTMAAMRSRAYEL